MNDETRAALVDSIAKRIDTFAEHVGYGDPDVTRDEAESYIAEIEEALLADRDATVAEPDAEATDIGESEMIVHNEPVVDLPEGYEYQTPEIPASRKFIDIHGPDGLLSYVDVFQMLGERTPGPDTPLLERIAESLWKYSLPKDREIAVRCATDDEMEHFRGLSRAAIATVFEALLSDEAVEAGAEALYRMYYGMFGVPIKEWSELRAETKQRYIGEFAQALKAAQSAFGKELDND